MYRILLIAVLISAVAVLAVDKKGTIEELKARLERVDAKDQIELSVEIAERQLKAADDAYSAGNAEQGLAAVRDIEEYGVRAAKGATSTGKRMKKTEIELRKIADKLEGIGKSVEVDNRPPVQEAVKNLEKARNDLLFRMFK
jgi:hypothetical protein